MLDQISSQCNSTFLCILLQLLLYLNVVWYQVINLVSDKYHNNKNSNGLRAFASCKVMWSLNSCDHVVDIINQYQLQGFRRFSKFSLVFFSMPFCRFVGILPFGNPLDINLRTVSSIHPGINSPYNDTMSSTEFTFYKSDTRFLKFDHSLYLALRKIYK